MGEELAGGFPVAYEAMITCPTCQTPLRLAPGWKVALPSAPEINRLLSLLGCPGDGCFVAVAGSTAERDFSSRLSSESENTGSCARSTLPMEGP